MEDQIFTPQETPTLDDVMNTEQEDVVYTPLDNVIDDEIHTQTEPSDIEIPESEEIETGKPIEVTIENQIITPKKNRIDFQGYELDNISEADNENDVPSIKQVRDIVEEVESEKQDKLTAGDNITITDNVISATDTTYTAGDNISISDENVISATDTTYSAGSGITLTDTTFSIGSKAIETGMIDDGAVTNGKIAENAITTTEIADEAITTSKIGDVQVTADKLASNAVTTAKIADANVTSSKIDWSTFTYNVMPVTKESVNLGTTGYRWCLKYDKIVIFNLNVKVETAITGDAKLYSGLPLPKLQDGSATRATFVVANGTDKMAYRCVVRDNGELWSDGALPVGWYCGQVIYLTM